MPFFSNWNAPYHVRDHFCAWKGCQRQGTKCRAPLSSLNMACSYRVESAFPSCSMYKSCNGRGPAWKTQAACTCTFYPVRSLFVKQPLTISEQSILKVSYEEEKWLQCESTAIRTQVTSTTTAFINIFIFLLASLSHWSLKSTKFPAVDDSEQLI